MDLRSHLAELAARQVFIGTSSWKYAGWLGDIYTESHYHTRGRFSEKKFNDACLCEYAQTFPTVGGDFSFYKFYDQAYWDSLFAQVPKNFQFGLKVPEAITCPRWPSHARYGPRKGQENVSFLDPGMFETLFLAPLEPYQSQVGPVMFEFGTLSKAAFPDPAAFAQRLEPFLASLPTGWKYAVEIRNSEYLVDEYLSVLRRYNVAHVMNSWTRMPPLDSQASRRDLWTADFGVCRALLRPGRDYETAVDKFEPYTTVQQEYPEAREGLRKIIEDAAIIENGVYIYVNNRLEGNAPGTIRAIIGGVGASNVRSGAADSA